MSKNITTDDLKRAVAQLRSIAIRPSAIKCPECGKAEEIWGVGLSCAECRGLHFVEWEEDGNKFSGVFDKHGTPALFGPWAMMSQLSSEDDRRKAAMAGRPILDTVPRYRWNPSTERFDL